MQLIFATNNKNKYKEVLPLLSRDINLKTLSDIACKEELPETHETIEENSLEKAQYVYDTYKINCFAEDTGLVIEALKGEPGVYSARYAGNNCSSMDNMKLVLKKMQGHSNRLAYFKTIITLILDGEIVQFEGKIAGSIETVFSGHKGFGYDPIFKPKGYDITFAEMPLSEKNKISHRALATNKLISYIHDLK